MESNILTKEYLLKHFTTLFEMCSEPLFIKYVDGSVLNFQIRVGYDYPYKVNLMDEEGYIFDVISMVSKDNLVKFFLGRLNYIDPKCKATINREFKKRVNIKTLKTLI